MTSVSHRVQILHKMSPKFKIFNLKAIELVIIPTLTIFHKISQEVV